MTECTGPECTGGSAPQHAGVEQFRRRLDEMDHLIELLSDVLIDRRGLVYAPDVPMQKGSADRAISLDCRISQILADGELPGDVDQFRSSALEPSRVVSC